MPRPSRTARQRAALLPPAMVLVALLALVGLTGGSARPDVLSLLVLRPLSLLLAGYALLGLTRDGLRAWRGYLALLGASIALLLAHLAPLPPGVWQALPGRELLVEIDRGVGLGDIWRPLSLDPLMTRNALWAMAAPLAALALGARLDAAGARQLLTAVLAIGLLSGLLGVMQFASGHDSPLYLYRIANFGSAVGLLANRNHAGVFLATLLPLFAAYAALAEPDPRHRAQRRIAALAAAAMIVPMVLATGSRAGLVAVALGLAGAVAVYRPHFADAAAPRRGARETKRWRRPLLIGLAVAGFLAFVTLSIGMLEGNSLARLLGGGGDDRPELRWTFWSLTIAAGWEFWPVGSGLGSFVRVFQVFEPQSILRINYVNHAHNDYVELFLDGGLPALALVAAALALVARDGWKVWRAPGKSREVTLARAGFVALVLFALASGADYPLRTPFLAVVAVIYAVWLRRGALAVAAGH